MITVKCGFSNCKWGSKQEIGCVARMNGNNKQLIDGIDFISEEQAKNILHSDLLKHLEAKHGIPPAIWER